MLYQQQCSETEWENEPEKKNISSHFGSITVIHILEFILFLYHLQNSHWVKKCLTTKGTKWMFSLLGSHHSINVKLLRDDSSFHASVMHSDAQSLNSKGKIHIIIIVASIIWNPKTGEVRSSKSFKIPKLSGVPF